MARLVALLRGINLGSKRRVAMADLRALLSELGYTDVRTVLASGNAVLTGPKAKAREKLEAGLDERFDMKIDVVLRTMDELQAVVDADPFGDEVTNATRYFVVFLDAKPDAAKLRALDRRGLRARQARRERPRAVRVVSGRHAEQPADEGARQARAGRHRDRPQLEHRQQAVGVEGGRMLCMLTVRRLKPAKEDAFREAWTPHRWHERMVRAYHLRSEDDPTQVITLGFFEGTEEELDAMRDSTEWMTGEERRLQRIAPAGGVDPAQRRVERGRRDRARGLERLAHRRRARSRAVEQAHGAAVRVLERGAQQVIEPQRPVVARQQRVQRGAEP